MQQISLDVGGSRVDLAWVRLFYAPFLYSKLRTIARKNIQ